MEAEPSLPAKVPVYTYRYSMVLNGTSSGPLMRWEQEGVPRGREYLFQEQTWV